MASKHTDIIDAIVARLGAASFTLTITPSKRLLDVNRLEDIDSDVLAVVVPGAEEWEKVTRGPSYQKDFNVNVVVRAQCDGSNAAVDGFMELSEEIKEDLIPLNMAGRPCVGVSHPAPYNLDMMVDDNIFHTIIEFKYREYT